MLYNLCHDRYNPALFLDLWSQKELESWNTLIVSNQVLLCLTAKTGEGLQEGMEWVVKQVKKK